jgi:hypothetical protein
VTPIHFYIESVEARPDGSICVQGTAERWGQSLRWAANRPAGGGGWLTGPLPGELSGSHGNDSRMLVYEPEERFKEDLLMALAEAENWGELEIQRFHRRPVQLPLPF